MNYPRMTLAVITAFSLLGVFTVSQADTYNFIMGSQKGKKVAEAPPSESGETQTQEQGDWVRSSRGSQPLIINNVNNNSSTNINGLGTPKKMAIAESPAPLDSGIAASLVEKKTFPSFRFSLTATSHAEGTNFSYATDPNVYGSTPMYGMNLGVGWSPIRILEIKPFVGLQKYVPGTRYSSFLYAGLDLEFTPFRISFADTWDLFRLSAFVGASTLGNTYAEGMPRPHAGVRTTFHVGSGFGLTAGIRVNPNFYLFDLGLTTTL